MKKEFNAYEIKGIYTYLLLGSRTDKSITTFIDTKNLDLIKDTNLRFHAVWKENTRSYYARATKYLGIINGFPKYEMVYLHHIIKPLPENTQLRIDHKNHNTLDNTEENIIFVTVSGNAINRKGINSNNTSGYRNVSWIQGFWRVQLQVNKKNYMFPERFDDINEAILFSELMRKKYYETYVSST